MPFARTYQRGQRSVVALWVAVLVAGSCSTAAFAFTGAAQSVKLAGTWSGSYTGGYSGTFTLHWTQSRSRLKGTIALSNPHGTYNITGSVNGTGIKFGAVGVGALYSGSVVGIGPVDVRQMDERPGQGRVEGAQAPDPEQGQAPALTGTPASVRTGLAATQAACPSVLLHWPLIDIWLHRRSVNVAGPTNRPAWPGHTAAVPARPSWRAVPGCRSRSRCVARQSLALPSPGVRRVRARSLLRLGPASCA